MASMRKALQYTAFLQDRTCPACGRNFKTPQGVLGHLGQSKGCSWYKKGKLRDLGEEGTFEHARTPDVIVGEEQEADVDQNSEAGSEWDPEEAMQQLDEELYDLIDLQAPSDPAPSRSEDAPQAVAAGPSRHRLDDEEDNLVEVEHPTAGQVIRMSESLHTRWRRYFLGDGAPRDSVDVQGDVIMGDGERRENLSPANEFAPFASQMDWRIAKWAITEGIGHKSMDRLLAIPGVSILKFC